MEVAVERPPVKEEKRADTKLPEMVTTIGSALPIVFESFRQSPQRAGASTKPQEGGGSRLEAARAEMGEVREENERLKAALSRIVSDYKSLQMHFLKVHDEQQAAAVKTAADHEKLVPAAEPTKAPAPGDHPVDDDLVSLSLGTRSGRKGHERSASSGSGTADTTAADDDSHLSLGLGFARGIRSAVDDNDKAGPVLNLSSDSSSADAAAAAKPAAQAAAESRKSPSGGAGDGADDEVQQQAKKARVSVRVKCDTPTMNDGCQWRKYGQKISKGNPCPRAYYRCTVAPNCPVRKQVQRCADDKSILITTYEGAHNHQLPPAATAMASTTSAAAAMLTAGSTTSSAAAASLAGRHLPAALLGPTTMVSTAASCPTITLDLTAPHSSPFMMHSSASPYAAAGYESKALPAAWSSGYPAYGGGSSHQPSSYYAKGSPAMGGHLLFGGLSLSRPAEQLFGGGHSTYLQRSNSLPVAAPPAVTDTLAKALAADPSFQSVLATMITSYMGRGGGGEAAQK